MNPRRGKRKMDRYRRIQHLDKSRTTDACELGPAVRFRLLLTTSADRMPAGKPGSQARVDLSTQPCTTRAATGTFAVHASCRCGLRLLERRR